MQILFDDKMSMKMMINCNLFYFHIEVMHFVLLFFVHFILFYFIFLVKDIFRIFHLWIYSSLNCKKNVGAGKRL